MRHIFSVKTAPIQKPIHLLISMQFEFWIKEIIIFTSTIVKPAKKTISVRRPLV